MTRRYPVAIWQDAEGSFTARVLDGISAAAIDVTVANVLAQLKKYLQWRQRKDGVANADFEELELRDYRVRIRPEYSAQGTVFPIGTPFYLRVTCVHGQRRDGTLHCVLPTLDLSFSYQSGDPVRELVTEAVQQALSNRTPQELSRELMPPGMVLDAVHVSDGRSNFKNAALSQSGALHAVADAIGRRIRGARFHGAIQRDTEVRLLVERLVGDEANLLLLGESGVGKTTVLNTAIRQVLRRAKDRVSRSEEAADGRPVGRQFWRTSGQRLIAGMKYLGQWEERCEQMIEELAESNSILCVESLIELVRVGGQEAGASVASFLMPYLERGELRMVAEATAGELDACRRLLPGLAEFFQVIRIPEFSDPDARQVLATLLDHGRRNYRLEIEEGVASGIYRLFKRFQPYAAFPGRAAMFVHQLLDDAQLEGRRIGHADVLTSFRRETGLPEILLRDDLPLPYDDVLNDFRQAVLGQEDACRTAAGVVTALKTGLNDPRRPLGVLLFCGPTGVGKTEMAKALARYLFGAGAMRDRLVRLDMSEYAGWGAAQRLLVAADGQVSDFIKRIRRQPFVVVLFDEIEKAAPEVHDVLLGVLDEGRLTDRFGRTSTFRSTVIIMTSNLGVDRPASIGFDNAALPAFERIALDTFRPEFFNRIDAVVTFQPLSRETILALARRELEAIGARDGFVKARLQLAWSDEVVAHLATAGYDARYGARPLQRAVERLVVAPLSHWLLAHPTVRNRTISLQLDETRQIVVVETHQDYVLPTE